MHSQPNDGSGDDRPREFDTPRHELAENCSSETDGNDTFEAWYSEAGRLTARQKGFLAYGITAVTLAGIVLVLERDLVPVPESALSWITITGAAILLLIALVRYTQTRSRQSAE